MALRLITDATAEPVTAEEVKSFLKLPTTQEYTVINALIKTARLYGENYCKRAFNPQVWQLSLDRFPSAIEIPRPPLTTVSTLISIAYIDTSAATQTLGSTGYTVDANAEPGVIVPSTEADEAWPDTNSARNAVTITFTCGYPYDTVGGGSTSTVPEPIKTWIKMRVGSLLFNRESLSDGNPRELPRSFVDGLLDPYIIGNKP